MPLLNEYITGLKSPYVSKYPLRISPCILYYTEIYLTEIYTIKYLKAKFSFNQVGASEEHSLESHVKEMTCC